MDTNQHDFIKTIQNALGKSDENFTPVSQDTPPDDLEHRLDAFLNRKEPEQRALLDLFIQQAKPINMSVVPVKTAAMAGFAIKELIGNTQPEWGHDKSVITWKHPLIDELNLDTILSADEVTLYNTMTADEPDQKDREDIRKRLLESYIGITSADLCVAESATLVLRTRPEQPRAVSLVPSIHVAVIRMEQIIKDLTELYFRLKWDPKEQETGLTNCMTFISGPSKTGDIELQMVHGAHGPRQLITYVITG